MIVKVALTNIHPNPYQPESRLNIPDDIAEKFGKSILEHGLLQTPVVRQVWKGEHENLKEITYEMGDGWLRLSGFKWLIAHGHAEFNEMPLDVRELTDQQMADMILEANTVRKDMTPIDEAKLYKKYLEDFKITQADLARSHNISQGQLANKIRLLELPEEIQGKIISQEITEAAARQLLRVKAVPELQTEILNDAVKNNYTINQIDQVINRELWHKTQSLHQSDRVFDMDACADCQNTVMANEPYGSNKKEKRCLDEKCWNKKQSDYEISRVKAFQEETGKEGKPKILTAKDVDYNQKEDISDTSLAQLDSPEECAICSKTALYKYFHDVSGPATRICLNPTCFRSKKSKKTREVNAAEKKQDQELTAKLAEAFKALTDISSVKNCLLVTAMDMIGD